MTSRLAVPLVDSRLLLSAKLRLRPRGTYDVLLTIVTSDPSSQDPTRPGQRIVEAPSRHRPAPMRKHKWMTRRSTPNA